MTRISRRRLGAVFVFVAVVMALAVLAAGCGGSSASSGSGVADIEDSSSPASEADSPGGTTEADGQDFQQAALDYAECMREQGIDVPDPDFSGGGGGGGLFGPNSDIDPNDPDFQAAQEECGDILQRSAPQISEEQQQEFQDTLLEFAQCMREHGVDVPDPDFSGGGGGFFGGGGGGNGGIDPDDPDFQAAQEACGDILQNAGFGGGPGGGGPPGGGQGDAS